MKYAIVALLSFSSIANAYERRIVKVTNLRDADSVIATVQDRLKARGYKGGRMILRQFDLRRLRTVLRTGTDRDAKSSAWAWPKFDSDDATRSKRQIGPERLIYGIDVNLNAPSMFSRRGKKLYDSVPIQYGKSVHLGLHLEDSLKDIKPGLGVAVYARDGLERAQIGNRLRAAGVEFWFKGKPKDSLLFVLAQKPK